MSRKKRNKKDEKRLEKIAIVTTILNLITAIVGLITKLIQ